MFHKYGAEHPESGLAEKVIGYQFSQKIEVTDPYTRKKDQKHLKPFMVNNSVNLFEKGKIILDPKDKGMISQLEEYRVKSISSAGMPVYTDENEHAIDAMNLALLIFEQKHGTLLKKIFSIKTVFIGTLDNRDLEVKKRDFVESEDDRPIVSFISRDGNAYPDRHYGIVAVTGVAGRSNRRSNMFQRRKF